MSSLVTNSTMTPSEVLSLNLNDSALDLLNAAIASHQSAKVDKNDQDNSTNDASPTTTHAKRELDKDDGAITTAPKRAGRKPLDKSQTPDASLDPKQKRKAQNRAAQRAFRDRKEKHVAELQARIDELEAQNAVKDEDLVKENETLKEMLKKLQEENYALKGAQFTFEFPVQDKTNTVASTSPKDSHYQTTTSGSSMSSGNSFSGEDVEHSPLSNTLSNEDDSTASADTPTTTNMFTAEPMQFGLIHDNYQQNSLDFLAVTDSSHFGLGNGLSTSQNFPTSTDFSNIDLFHGKDDLFTNYRVPPSTTTTDDFMFAEEDLGNLFGGNNELFGFNNDQFSFNQQFDLPETPVTRRSQCTQEKKAMMLAKIKQSQQEGKYICDVSRELHNACPDFNLDLLCDEMKKKASCTSQYPITDYDVDAFVKCLDRV